MKRTMENHPVAPRRQEVVIAGNIISPGQRRSIDIPVAQFTMGTRLSLPIEVICGARPGPRVWLSATIHGEELNGLEIIRRVLEKLDPQAFAGALIAAPVMNAIGFMNQTRTLPDGSDLNRAFPSAADGSIAEQLAHFFVTEIVSQCSCGIDLHSGANHASTRPRFALIWMIGDESFGQSVRCADSDEYRPEQRFAPRGGARSGYARAAI